MNISLMANKSKKEYAYTMIDVESEVSGQIAKALGSSRRCSESKSDRVRKRQMLSD